MTHGLEPSTGLQIFANNLRILQEFSAPKPTI